MAKQDYERFASDLVRIINEMGSVSVAGIPTGLVDDLTFCMHKVFRLAQSAYVAAREDERNTISA